ncbi:DsrE family protein [Glaciimonas soli]|uniref:DsrE family protein n=1 Tax=Glaciimonas soli TaxID=2590999 RepID=A0A843YJ11_9BURK|nr:DsrE family protein [Glaciimonas soli]MQQ99768.1 hypothetical protein [Glaciimonas soli]
MNNLFKSRRTLFLSSLAITGLAGFFGKSAKAQTPQAANVTAKGIKAVFAISDADPKKWWLTLGNVKNAQKEIGNDNATLEIVVYGPAIEMLLAKSEVADKVSTTVASGVKIVACENSMHGAHFSHDDMISTIAYVPSGVVELMKRQNEGYAYIRS